MSIRVKMVLAYTILLVLTLSICAITIQAALSAFSIDNPLLPSPVDTLSGQLERSILPLRNAKDDKQLYDAIGKLQKQGIDAQVLRQGRWLLPPTQGEPWSRQELETPTNHAPTLRYAQGEMYVALAVQDSFGIPMQVYLRAKDEAAYTLLHGGNGDGRAGRMLQLLAWVTMLLLVMSNGAIALVVSNAILKPLKRLQQGAEQLKLGNLDYEIGVGGRDEIGQLMRTFEQMRKQTRSMLRDVREAEEARKQMLANLAHDVRTPLTSVVGYLEGLRDGVANTEEKRERYIETALSRAKSLQKLMEELFLFSKIDIRKLELNTQPIRLMEFLRETVEELQEECKAAEMELVLAPQTREAYVEGDREQLRRVIWNLVENSVRYKRAEPGRIEIRVRIWPQQVDVEIVDDGIGIQEESLERVFERFYRGDAARSKTEKGSGLGLAIVKQIVEAHGGTVQAQRRLRGGTVMRITLPGKMSGGEAEEN